MLDTLSNKQALADGVLDLKGNLSEIKFGSGRQAFLARLQQLVTATPTAKVATPEIAPAVSADRPRGFAAAAHQRINGALLRCEERFPNDGPHSVLYVVVDKDAPQWREKLGTLYGEYFAPGQCDPLSPVRLEVMDRATDDTVQRLIELGLVARTTRATRSLWPAETAEAAPPPLSEAEREKAASFRQQAARKLKMARLLGEGDLAEEARAALLEAVLPMGQAFAIEGRLPAPMKFEDALLPPLAQHWRDGLTPLRQFIADATLSSKAVLEQLAAL